MLGNEKNEKGETLIRRESNDARVVYARTLIRSDNVGEQIRIWLAFVFEWRSS